METLANDPDGLAQRKQQERRQHHRTKVAVEIELWPEAVSVPLRVKTADLQYRRFLRRDDVHAGDRNQAENCALDQ